MVNRQIHTLNELIVQETKEENVRIRVREQPKRQLRSLATDRYVGLMHGYRAAELHDDLLRPAHVAWTAGTPLSL